MEFLVYMEISGQFEGGIGPSAELLAGEAKRAREPAAAGILRRLWRVPGVAPTGAFGTRQRWMNSTAPSRRCRSFLTLRSPCIPWRRIRMIPACRFAFKNNRLAADQLRQATYSPLIVRIKGQVSQGATTAI